MRVFYPYVVMMVMTSALTPAALAQVNPDLPALPPEMGNDVPVSDSNATLPPPPVIEASPNVETVNQSTDTSSSATPSVTQTTTVTTTTNSVPANQVQDVFPSAGANVVTIPSAPTNVVEAQQPSPQMKENYIPSYGDFPQSLLFSGAEIDRMKRVLFAYESVKRVDTPAAITPEVEIPIAVIEEPKQYPSFYLSSIVYRTPKDWLLWMNGGKYSPKKRPGEVTLLSISPRLALFSWKPEYIQQAKMRFEEAMIDTTIPKHFKAAMSNVRYDEKREAFVFALAPNQSFVGAAFGIYEGKYASRDVPEMEQQAQVDAILTPAVPSVPNPTAGRDPDAGLRETMQGLDRMRSNLTQLAPRNNPNAPSTPNVTGPTPTASSPGASISLPPATLMPTTITLDPPPPAEGAEAK
ncbi:MAG: hypothetical protein ACOYJ2_03325 [Rickettsiales bacterium]